MVGIAYVEKLVVDTTGDVGKTTLSPGNAILLTSYAEIYLDSFLS